MINMVPSIQGAMRDTVRQDQPRQREGVHKKLCDGRVFLQIIWPYRDDQNGSFFMMKLTPEEAVEVALLLWEYDRDGSIAIDNFIHREPQLSEKMAVNLIPKKLQRAYLAYLNRQKR